tara:strand:+ start:14462 stop:14677 length:216 start_codon:yes stop_codon:yes gene_type:complete
MVAIVTDNMELLTLFIHILVLVVTVVWAIAKINTTSQILTNSVKSLDNTVQKLDTKLDEHSERIAKLEAVK